MQSRERMRPGGPVAPGYPAGGGPGSPYSRGYSRGNSSKRLCSPSRKYEVLLEAGRLATEYLVSTGVLPPNSAQRSLPSGNSQDFKGSNGNFQDYRGPVNQNPGYSNDLRGSQDNRRRRFNNDDYERWRPRKDNRGKRKLGYYKRGYSDNWDRNRGRNGGGRGYSDDEEEDEEEYGGGPSYLRERRGMNVDEVGSSVSGVAGESGSAPVKRETQRESGSDLEDTGSKASSCSIRKDTQLEAGEVSNAEHGEVSNEENVDARAGTDVGSGDKDVDMPEESRRVEDGEDGENDSKNLLEFCDHAKAPTKPRSVLPQNRGQIVDPVANEGIAETTSNDPVEGLSSQTVENRENKDVEMPVPVVPAPPERAKEEVNSYSQPIILEEEQEVKQEVATKTDKEMTECKAGTGLVSDEKPELDITMQEVQEREKGLESASFKVLDLNVTNNQEVTEIPDDPIPKSEPDKEKMVEFGGCGTDSEVNVGESSYQYQGNQQNDVVQVIHIADSPIAEIAALDQAKPKESGEPSYPSTENMLANIGNVDVMPSMQDGYNFTISDYLGSDICYQMQTDLQPGVISGVDDSIYGSLGDIGFEVWDQQNPDYERFF